MLDKISAIGVDRTEILHTAESMFHDHAPANKYNLGCCHIYRRHQQKGFGATMIPENMPTVQFQFNSMEEMAQAVREELQE